MNIYETIELIKKSHGETNEIDKGGKTPYYWHLVRVMLRTKSNDIEVLLAALMHDLIEDTKITKDDLLKMGYSKKTVDYVVWCSRNMFQDLNFKSWMQKMADEAPDEVILIKLADIADNLGFERMRGLMIAAQEKINEPSTKNKKQKPLLIKKIDKKVEKGQRLSGEMGVFTRYYEAWNILCSNKRGLKLASQILSEDFCNINDLLELRNYLPKEEIKTYLDATKIHTWKINAEVKEIKDSAGNSYIALDVDKNVFSDYQNFLKTKDEKMNEYIDLKTKRDRGDFHITLINAMEYKNLEKTNKDALKKFKDEYLYGLFELFTYGIGSVEDGEKKCWYTICENSELQTLRKNLGLGVQNFHVTLAFKNKDVHVKELPKNKETVVYKNNELWNFLNFGEENELLKKTKLNF